MAAANAGVRAQLFNERCFLTVRKVHATPTKDFFVRMITKDISLEDCILDLIDNSLDGVRKIKSATEPTAAIDSYAGYWAHIQFDARNFQIQDNCGGISISDAIDYAFHFGRRSDAPPEDGYSIGLYGIGMKRAIFKMGNNINIYSSTDREAFRTNIDVNEWLTRQPVSSADGSVVSDDWDFDMDAADLIPATGTLIGVSNLHSDTSSQLGNPTFENGLARIIARDYAQFLMKGFEILLNGKRIHAFQFTVRESNDFRPVHVRYLDESGVEVELIAGMAGLPPDDIQPQERSSETDYYGWFVLCNDRVVVASDKTDMTVWGDSDFNVWHFQYNGFIGVLSFTSKIARLLPWTTTKRDVDRTNPIYRRAVERMKDATRPWIKYTNDRKADLGAAREREAAATARPLFQTSANNQFKVPIVVSVAPHVAYSSIQYRKPTSEIAKVKKMLGNQWMPNYEVGVKTFDYYLSNESED